MKAEDRNELLRTNKDVVLATLQAFSQLEKVLTLDQIQHCIKLKYGKECDLRLAHSQAGASDDPPKARPSLMMWPTEEAATAPMEEYHGLSAVGADGLLSAIPGRISSGTDPDADVGESGMESADAEPQEEDEADAGEAEENDAEQSGEDDAEQAEEDDAEQHEEDDAEQQEDDAEQPEDDAEQAEEDKDEGADQGHDMPKDQDAAAQNEHKKSESEELVFEAPAKKVKRNEDGPLWGAMQAFIRHAKKEHGKSFREAQTLWKHSLIRS
ncbi:unnamed protein product, partial [Symbiodinium necroappetens]